MTATGILFLTLALGVIIFIFMVNRSGRLPSTAAGLSSTPTFSPTHPSYFTRTPYNTPVGYPTADLGPPTGKLRQFSKFSPGCASELKVCNRMMEQDAVVILSNKDTNAIAAGVYVRAGDCFDYREVPSGNLYTFVTIGQDWDNFTGRFTRNAYYYRFEVPTIFACGKSKTQSVGIVQEITLNAPNGSETDILSVEPDSFPGIAP